MINIQLPESTPTLSSLGGVEIGSGQRTHSHNKF